MFLLLSCVEDTGEPGELQFGGTAESGDEEVGEAILPLAALGAPTNVNTAGPTNTKSPTVAWIREKNSGGGTQNPGFGLIAFTRDDSVGERLAWSRSANWHTSSPTWTTRLSNDASLGVRWPAPDNLCEFFSGAFECDGTGDGWNKNQAGFVQKGRYTRAVQALGTGLDEVAAIVATGGYNADNEEVLIGTSINGGQLFTHSLILSVNDASGADSGGAIDPDSVHASVAALGEVTTPRAGQVGLPIYVTWRGTVGGTSRWWWTRVVVGASGTVAQTMKPRRLDFIPAFVTNHASIFGYRKSGVEHIGVAWSERTDSAIPTTCPSSASVGVSWYASQSMDFGDNWSCFRGNYNPGGTDPPFVNCSAAKKRTTIATETTWKPCVGPNNSGRQSANNDRPEIGMNMPADKTDDFKEDETKKYWTFVVNHRGSGTGMRVCSYRTGGSLPVFTNPEHDRLLKTACSADNDPSGVAVEHAWGQSISVMNSAVDKPLTTILIKESTTSVPAGIRMIALELDGNTGTTFVETRVTTTPFTVEGGPGLTTGVATAQRCDPGIAGCVPFLLFTYPQLPAFGAWPDASDTATTQNNVVTEKWLW
jgi:hypothetical protein